jgi:hypothetical protein
VYHASLPVRNCAHPAAWVAYQRIQLVSLIAT